MDRKGSNEPEAPNIPPGRQGNRARLTEGPVTSGLAKLAAPMVMGMLGMVIFNLTDTYYVGQLGPQQLAALSFTFPVVMVLNAAAQGVGLSSSALVSRAVGAEDMEEVRKLTGHSLLLGVTILAVILTGGLLTVRPLFQLLGAEGIVLDYVAEYMTIWYFGSIMVVIPMIGNNIIRGLGDTKTPGTVMAISAGMNVILDPLLIFGLGPFPTLGIRGAALATVISRSLTAVIAIYVLAYREKILRLQRPRWVEVWSSWRQLLYIAVPNALINMALPLGSGVVTRLLAGYGTAVVAGFGVATRVEMIAMVFIGAVASVSGPFAGQNLGARKFDRVTAGMRTGEGFSLAIGVIAAVGLGWAAPVIAGLFTDDPEVVVAAVRYMRIVPIAYGFQGILRISATVLNVLKRPFESSGLTLLQTFGVYIPAAVLLGRWFGIDGIFAALTISYFLVGSLAHYTVHRKILSFADQVDQGN